MVFRKQPRSIKISSKMMPFPLQCLQHQVVHRPKGILRKRRSTEAVLIGNHHKFKVEFAADKSQITKNLRIKLQFMERIQLVVNRWLYNQRTVTIYKQRLSSYFNIHNSSMLPTTYHSPDVYQWSHANNHDIKKYWYGYAL